MVLPVGEQSDINDCYWPRSDLHSTDASRPKPVLGEFRERTLISR